MSETGTAARIWTIGYQGQELDAFIARLREAGVTMLVDVRRRAQSRKKGFSKTALKNVLAEAGIDYMHLRHLGMPDDLMPKRNLDDNTEILDAFRRRLDADVDPFIELYELMPAYRVCLMCFEADHRLCHRTVIADLLGVETINL